MSEGIDSQTALKLLTVHGYNELPSARPKNIGRIALEVMKEPMFILLIICGMLYMILGDYLEGITLLSSIFIIIFITFYQYQKTEKALDALRKLSSPRALVIRDGKELRIPGREVVPGDLIILNEGDRIPADARILESINLTVDESIITGESLSVRKNIHESGEKGSGIVLSGTLVVQGKGIACVTETGSQTRLGKIGTSLNTITQDETRLQQEMKILIKNFFIIGAIISIGVVFAFYFTRGNFLQSLLNGLAASIAILPEEFAVVLTIFLALGAWRLSRKNVLTRKPSAIETLGSATVLCADKTGTITQNKMEVTALYNGDKVFLKNSFSENQTHLSELIKAAHRASQKNSIDPMEKAILRTRDLLLEMDSEQNLLREYPLSSELLAMTRVLESVPENSV